MLKTTPKLVSPELLKTLCEMGHGDEIVIADGNFPAENLGRRVIRADGISGTAMLDAVLSLIPLDTYAEKNFLLMGQFRLHFFSKQYLSFHLKHDLIH